MSLRAKRHPHARTVQQGGIEPDIPSLLSMYAGKERSLRNPSDTATHRLSLTRVHAIRLLAQLRSRFTAHHFGTCCGKSKGAGRPMVRNDCRKRKHFRRCSGRGCTAPVKLWLRPSHRLGELTAGVKPCLSNKPLILETSSSCFAMLSSKVATCLDIASASCSSSRCDALNLRSS